MRLTVPKGRLFEQLRLYLKQAGVELVFRHGDRDYSPLCLSDPTLTIRLKKPRSIPQLLALNTFQFGFCGLDIIRDADYENVMLIADLGLNSVRIMVAIHETERDVLVHPPRRPLVIATEYTNLARKWAMDHGLAAIVINTYGSTEGYAPEDADIIIDCVESGATMQANGLEIVEELFQSTTWLAASREVLSQPNFLTWIRRLASEPTFTLETINQRNAR